MKAPKTLLTAVLLSLIAAGVCLRIEWLNRESGNYLPRRDIGEGNNSWRSASVEFDTWKRFKQLEGIKVSEDTLNSEQQREYNEWRKYETARNNLKGMVYGPGLLCYPITFIGTVLGAIAFFRNRHPAARTAAIVSGLVAIASLCFLFSRGVFTSFAVGV